MATRVPFVALLFARILLRETAVTTTVSSSALFHDSDMDGLLFLDSLLFDVTEWHVIECARRCSDDSTCVAFTFTGAGSCRGHNATVTSAVSNTATSSGAKTFTKATTGDNQGEKQKQQILFGCCNIQSPLLVYFCGTAGGRYRRRRNQGSLCWKVCDFMFPQSYQSSVDVSKSYQSYVNGDFMFPQSYQSSVDVSKSYQSYVNGDFMFPQSYQSSVDVSKSYQSYVNGDFMFPQSYQSNVRCFKILSVLCKW